MNEYEPMRTLGNTVKAARLARGLAIQQVAARCGLTDTQYRRLEECKSLPPNEVCLLDLERGLGLRSTSLLLLAEQYKTAMRDFLGRFDCEIKALVFFLKQYSGDEIEQIIARTIKKKKPRLVPESSDKKHGKRKVYVPTS